MVKVGPIDALVVRKRIKNVHVSVLPPSGKVRVTAPIEMKDDAIRVLLSTRLAWINKQQDKFKNQLRQTPREYVSGESHYLFGQRYQFEVYSEDRPPRVEIQNNRKILLIVRPGSSLAKREEVMTEWYRAELRAVAEDLIHRWQKKIGVTAKGWSIKRMKTRWGTCNQETGRILLNLELAKKPISCVEYVVVHELLHLIEKKHNDRFVQLMSKYIPKWRSEKEELNRFILSHEEWCYEGPEETE